MELLVSLYGVEIKFIHNIPSTIPSTISNYHTKIYMAQFFTPVKILYHWVLTKSLLFWFHLDHSWN